ncbi:MAG TPA: glycosyltransferase family 2 protein [Solirubrobacteraceae bacterium]|jgi:biofilm PGA synthesis N-glycosyltransferase PgaC|nr:glycosyltransferase family 2 protein [Solirubrobacteraceae bacterium]
MPIRGDVTLPAELLLTRLALVGGALGALLIALAMARGLARARQRAARRVRRLADPVTGLGSRVALMRDLRILSREGAAAGTHLLATFELPELYAHDLQEGIGATNELLRRLGRRLDHAVGRAGGVYALGRGRYGVLARIGRISEEVIMKAATAALLDVHAEIDVWPRISSATVRPGEESARSILRRLEEMDGPERPGAPERLVRPGELGAPEGVDEHADQEVVGRPRESGAALAQTAPTALVELRSGAPAARVGSVDPSPTAPERVGPPKVPRRPSHEDGRVGGKRTGRRGREALGGPHGAPEAPDTLAAARNRDMPRRNPPPRWMPYLRVTTRFWVSVGCGLMWMGLSAWIAWPWIRDLAGAITLPGALLLITGIALIPGYLNIQLVSSLLLDHPAPIDFDFDYPGLTLLVAAYNEECDIAPAIAYALAQEYPAPLHLFVIDDGSSDETVSIATSFAHLDGRVRVMEVPHGGKAEALNAGLRATETPLVATIDADTLLMPDALRRIVSRMLLSPNDTVAVAGSVMVRNSRESLITAAQTWDYFLGIGSIKRQQALLQATLVAQGAFSVYDTEALRAAGGWPDCIGEDIVMTWALLDRGGRTSYEPSAVAFTEAPVTLRTLARQRRRWARGMIEGLRTYGRALLGQRLPYVHSVAVDVLFPYLDVTFTLAFIPGIVLAIFGNYAIVGPTTLAVLPLNVLISGIMYRRQRSSFTHAGLRVRQNVVGFVTYLLGYQLLMSPVSVAGYVEELFRRARRW